MSKSKHIDRICAAVLAAALIITLLFVGIGPRILQKGASDPAYARRLFSNDKMHTLDIVVNDKDWKEMLDNALDKQYIPCNVVIDGEHVKNVAIRTKGASSLFSVFQSDSDRFSFKLEFDHYEPSKTYHGLDKLALNNLIQDNTYLMDYLAYDMMRKMGVSAPLASFIWITVNGRDFGLYLAVEGIEDAFAQRNYGNDRGNIYKPDSENLLGMGSTQELPPPQDNGAPPMDGTFGADDVSLLYSDDDPKHYSNIFDHSVFGDVGKADQKRLIQSLKKLNEQKDLSKILDINDVIEYFAVHNFLVNGDSYTGILVHNYYLREHNGRLSMIPWDYNLSFGGMLMNFAQLGNEATSYINAPIDSPVSGGDAIMQTRPMISWIFSDETYKEMYHQAVSDFIAEYFESGYFDGLLQKSVALISSYVEKDPTAFASHEEFLKGTQTLKNFCDLRAKSIRGQLNGTIPSTIEGQEADPASLIDGSSINLNDMTKEGDFGAGTAAENGAGAAPATAVENGAGDDMALALPDEGGTAVEGATDQSAVEQRASDQSAAEQNTAEQSDDSGQDQTAVDALMEVDSGASMVEGAAVGSNTQDKNELPQLPLLVGSIVLLMGGIVFVKFYK